MKDNADVNSSRKLFFLHVFFFISFLSLTHSSLIFFFLFILLSVVIHFQPRLEGLPALHERSVRSWCLFKLDVSCVGRESDQELSSAAVALPTLEMSYVNTIHFIPPWEEIIIDVLWKEESEIYTVVRNIWEQGKRRRLSWLFLNPPFS